MVTQLVTELYGFFTKTFLLAACVDAPPPGTPRLAKPAAATKLIVVSWRWSLRPKEELAIACDPRL